VRQLIAGNWKMNGLSEQAAALAGGLTRAPAQADLVVCPPFTQIAQVAAILRGTAVRVGGQDCHVSRSGAHTGDVSAAMLADLGCSAVIVGHSERRRDHYETDALIKAKAEAAHQAGLVPIVCVGETAAQRDAGHAEAQVCAQVEASLPQGFFGAIAYEPIWAIGTGRVPHEANVAAMHAAIRTALIRLLGPSGATLRILYGGSVKPDNAAALLAVPDVGGALVGGASLDAAAFLAIAAAALQD
jgi:triosephosphate isomerase